jgi:hypothetical protein
LVLVLLNERAVESAAGGGDEFGKGAGLIFESEEVSG